MNKYFYFRLLLTVLCPGHQTYQNRRITNITNQLETTRFLFPLLIILLFSPNIQAENVPELEHLVNVSSITQDNKGYIWLSNSQGLTRFDGKNIITFSNNNNYWPLPFSHSHHITTTDNKILISTENNRLWELAPLSGKANVINIKTISPTIYYAVKFQDNYYAYGKAPDNLYRYNNKNSETKVLTENIHLSNLVATQKHLYFSTDNGLFQVKGDKVLAILKQPINAVSAVANGLIVATKNQLYYFSDDGNTQNIAINETIHAITPENQFFTNKSNNSHFFTIDSRGEIKKYQTKSLKMLTHKFSNAEPQFTQTMLHDNSGVLWLLSNLGLRRLTEKKIIDHPLKFDVYYNKITIEKFKNQLVIGTYGQGLQLFNKSSPVGGLAANIKKEFTKKGKIIYSLLAVENDLYITTFDGLWSYNGKTKQLKKIDIPNNNLILLDMILKDNVLYIGTDSEGLLIFDIEQQKITQHLGKGSGLSSLEVIGMLPLDNGEIWITTAAGLDIYNNIDKSLRNISIPSISKVGPLILVDNKIFVSTMGDGIFVFNRQGELISQFASGITFFTLKLINGEIWAPANPGLYRINPSNYQIAMVPDTKSLSFTGHPIQVEFNLYAPHSGGVLELPLIDKNIFNAKVFISKTIVSGQASIINKTINVDTPNDVITLELASLDYRPGQEKRYKYRINNGNWNEVYGHQLTLTGLASGLYDIEIMGTNSFGHWSSNKAYTEINVAYPWYWTPQMWVLYVLFTLGLLFTFGWLLYLRTKSISKIHQILSCDIKNRGKAALTVSRNLTYALELLSHIDQAGKGNPDIHESRLEKSKEILTQSIDELKSNTDSKLPDGLYGNSLDIALPFFSDYLHQKYHINLINTIELNEVALSYEMQADIYKIIYEAVTTAILNGNGRNFTMVLREVKSKVWLNISDDGTSFLNFNNNINFNMAMYYTRQIATKYNASVHTFNKKEQGSQLAISIPLMDIT